LGRGSEPGANIGAAIYIRGSAHAHILRCHHLNYGGRLFAQDANSDRHSNYGLRVSFCTCYGAHYYNACGDDAIISNNHFALPAAPGYDRTNIYEGSSHCLYIFGRHSNIVIANNVFANIRTHAIKASGSNDPIRNVVITGNVFTDCGGGVLFGADDVQEHTNCLIANNIFVDCGTNRTGWTENNAIHIVGSRAVTINANQFYYTRAWVQSHAAPVAIAVARYLLGAAGQGSPVEQVSIVGNCFQALKLDGVSPAKILNKVIAVQHAGQGAERYSAILVADNQLNSVGGIGVWAIANIGLIIERNQFVNVVAALRLQGNRLPVIRHNMIVPGANTSANAQLSFDNDSFPVVQGNVTAGRLSGGSGQSWTINANGGANAQDHPLLGTSGRLLPTEGKPEVVFAFGHDWRIGDTFDVRSTVDPHSTVLAYNPTITTVTDGVITGPPFDILTSGGASWEPSDVGADIAVVGAGPDGALLLTKIQERISHTEVRLALPHASMAVSGARVQYARTLSTITASMMAGEPGLAVSSEAFAPTDVGKSIVVAGAGPGNTDLVTTIAIYRSPKLITLAALAGASVTNGMAFWVGRGAGPFADAASLIALLDNVAHLDAADYGSFFSPPLITNHIRLRWSSVVTNTNRFYIASATAHKTAGVVLGNGTGANALKCYSRGEAAAGPRSSRTVIWSPLAHWGALVILTADNATANTHLVTNGYYPLRNSADSGVDSGVDIVLEHTAAFSKKVSSATITNGGSGYTSAPTVIFSASPGGTSATGTATISGGQVIAITITNPGSGYSTAAIISFSGGGGTNATASAIMIPEQEFRWSLNG
jgi:hypothetical protein